MANLTGQTLGKYAIIERRAQGGMAEVYKAFQPGIERDVVIKVLHSHLAESEDFVARFQREARAVGRLQHPHIVGIIDVGCEGDNHFMVMDYVQGGTLGEILKTEGRFPMSAALELTLQLAEALAAAHAQGIIHRDIKPSNVLFVDETHSQVVLTDFGLARLRDDTDATLTITGAMVGTPTYMSPEAVLGEPCDARADIYSLGVVLYEMLTGQPPYMANTPYSMMMKHTTESIPAPRTLNSALPDFIEELMLKALARNPAERFQSAVELAAAIRHAQHLLCGDQTSHRDGATPVPALQPSTSAAGLYTPSDRSGAWLSLALALSGIVAVAFLTAELLLHL